MVKEHIARRGRDFHRIAKFELIKVIVQRCQILVSFRMSSRQFLNLHVRAWPDDCSSRP